MDIDSGAAKLALTTVEPLPEAEIYIRLLLIHHLLASASTKTKAKELAQQTVAKIQTLNRRSLDPIAAKVWYALERAYEINEDLAAARP
jgi:26S proteasome regulatory subunit N3